MKISNELARVLTDASKEVARWPKWKRSMDPIGDKAEKVDEGEPETQAEADQVEDSNAA